MCNRIFLKNSVSGQVFKSAWGQSMHYVKMCKQPCMKLSGNHVPFNAWLSAGAENSFQEAWSSSLSRQELDQGQLRTSQDKLPLPSFLSSLRHLFIDLSKLVRRVCQDRYMNVRNTCLRRISEHLFKSHHSTLCVQQRD